MVKPFLSLFFLFVATKGLKLKPADDHRIKFHVISSRSIDEPPTVDVTFGDGFKDSLQLELFQLNMETPLGCRYIGRLQNSPSSSVAVTGCLNKPDDKMEVTMISDRNFYNMFSVDFSGNTEVIKNPLGNEAQSLAMIKNRDGAWHKEGDEVINNAVIEAAMSANVKAVPSKLRATIQFGYDFGLESYLEETNETFDSWIANVFTHTQAHFRHNESLGTTIEFEPVGPAIRPQQEWNQNKHWTADNDIWQAKLESNIAARENGIIADTYSWFCNRGGGGVAGVAFVAELCNHRAVNLNERQRTYASSGFVLAHELGHNFGMLHDFDRYNGGHLGPCNGRGIMSYGCRLDTGCNRWSSCSRSNMEHNYFQWNWGGRCLDILSAPNDTDRYVAPCGTVVTESDAILKSKNYPLQYPKNESCQWVIQYEKGEKVKLEFTAFDVELSKECVSDWIEIRDGPDSNAPLIGGKGKDVWPNSDKICGFDLPGPIISTSNSLFIRFITYPIGDHNRRTGFRAIATKIGAATTVSPTTITPTEGPDVTTPEPEPCFDNDAQYKGEAVKKPGKKYKLTNILSALVCQQKCQENPKCEYFTWNAGTGPGRWNKKNRNTCWLKKNKGNVRRSSKDAGKISGKKEC